MEDDSIVMRPDLFFLSDGGEMGELIRKYDWSQTSLGSPDRWPQSLKTTVGILIHSKLPIFLFWGNDLICFYNDSFRPSLGNEGKHPSSLGKTGPEVWHEIWHIIKPWIDQVLVEKRAVWKEDQLVPFYRNGRIENIYWTFSYSPVFNEEGVPAGVFVACQETTNKVENIKRLERANRQFRDMVMKAPVAIAVFRGEDFVAEIANDALLPLVGKTRHEFIGRPMFESLPEIKDEMEPRAKEIVRTGKPLYAYEFELVINRYGKDETCFFNFIWEPLFEEDGTVNGFIAVAHEVTKQVLARKKAEEAQEKARLAIEVAELGTVEVDLQTNETITSPRLETIFDVGHTSERMRYISAIHPADLATRNLAYERAYQNGILEYEARVIKKDQSLRWIRVKGRIFFDESNKPLKLVGVVQDITEEKEFAQELFRQVKERTGEVEASKQEVEQSANRLKSIFNNAQSGMFIFAPVKNEAGEVIDFRFVITNPMFASYVSQTPARLNGDLGSRWFPGYMTNGVFDMYRTTYLTGETIRREIHYHVDQLDIFLDLMSCKVGDEVLVTFNDHTPLKRAQLQLEKYIEDLKRSNKNLEEFAYAASHDLKEPIRKIQIFSDRLKNSLISRMTDLETDSFERLESASRRMGSLVDDLLTYSQITLRPNDFDDISLKEVIEIVLNDLDLEIEEKGAKVSVGKMPMIQGYHRQLQQAFQNLISNSLKYAHRGTSPEIQISCKEMMGSRTRLQLSPQEMGKKFYQITVEDNGIGFKQEDAEKIFSVFTRLHGNKEYRGTGVGLSIVRKVMENHNGYVIADSEPEKGARFTIYLPVRQTLTAPLYV